MGTELITDDDRTFFDEVSIQLMSPASGDSRKGRKSGKITKRHLVSIQLMSPASGDLREPLNPQTKEQPFPFN